ncbi:MAG: glycoside hydrolase family 44 protein [Myxococcales bacterium]
MKRMWRPLIGLGVLAAVLACRSANARPKPAPKASSNLKLVDSVLTPGEPGVVDVTFEIHADQDARPISPMIYGINSDVKDAERQRWGSIRSGGNRLTAYNWETNASNAGSDWLFQNDSLMGESNEPAKPLLDIIDAASKISAATVITLSTSDYVSADKNGGGDVRASGPAYLSTRFHRNLAKKPAAFTPRPNPDDHFVYQDELVAYLRKQRPQAKLLFALDNEPELWSHTHAEVFPKPVTYADLWKRNHEFAKAAKETWPGIETLGFVSYGYLGFTSLQNAPDAGGRVFVDWYLDQAKAAHKSFGSRLIDYLDVHWYPEAQGGGQRIVSDITTPEVVYAREQAPRSLWDAKYEEKSWIRDSAGGPINLLNWLQGKIDSHYPGTKLALTEWNFGAGGHVSGAIATADVLGILGKFGVNLATYWGLSEHEAFAYAAFRAYRNFDNQGAQFGDTSIAATNSNVELGSVYASIDRQNPARTVIVAINKATTPKKAGLRLFHSAAYSSAKVYLLSGASPNMANAPSLTAVATNAFKYTMPPQSISVIVPELPGSPQPDSSERTNK